jgi:hypothetical protein
VADPMWLYRASNPEKVRAEVGERIFMAVRGPDLYICCEHCEHSPGYLPDEHLRPCPQGCNGEADDDA